MAKNGKGISQGSSGDSLNSSYRRDRDTTSKHSAPLTHGCKKRESNTVCFGGFFEDSESELSFPPSMVSEVRQPLPCTRTRTISIRCGIDDLPSHLPMRPKPAAIDLRRQSKAKETQPCPRFA